MKYFFVAFCLVFCLSFLCPTNSVFSNEENFARISDDEVFLLKSQNNEDILFQLPTSYFVKILDESDDFFYVEFDGIFGYTPKDNLTKVYQTPNMPFPKDITFSINNSVAAAIKTSPKNDSEILGFAPSNQKLKFFGKTVGDEAISGLGNCWFFAELKTNDTTIQGYVYSPLTEQLSNIPTNTEVLPTTPPQNSDSQILSENLTNPSSLWLVGILLAVVLALFLVTFLPFHIGKNKTSSANNKVVKI